MIKKSFLIIVLTIFSLQSMENQKGSDGPALADKITQLYILCHENCENPNVLIQNCRQKDQEREVWRISGTPLPVYADRAAYVEKNRKTTIRKAVSKSPAVSKCPFCVQIADSANDDNNYFISRSKSNAALLFNRFPYAPVQFLAICDTHNGKIEKINKDHLNQMFLLLVEQLKDLYKRCSISGYNLYFNLESRSAGASLPDHVHAQLRGRFQGDDSYLAAVLNELLMSVERQIYFQEFKKRKIGKLSKAYKLYADILRQYSGNSHKYHDDQSDCLLCKIESNPDQDTKNFVIKRFPTSYLKLNQWGLTDASLMLVLNKHKHKLADISPKDILHYTEALCESVTGLKAKVKLAGYNIVANDTPCSKFWGHPLMHIIPRNDNDFSGMALIDPGVILHNKDPKQVYKELREFFFADTTTASGS